MQIFRLCVSSEDIKSDSGATKLLYSRRGDITKVLFSKYSSLTKMIKSLFSNCSKFSPAIIKNNELIGFVDVYNIYSGSDFIIKGITIYKNKTLSDKLTEKYTGKILICSLYKDESV